MTTATRAPKTKDDYSWDRYTKEYLWEIDHGQNQHGLTFRVQRSRIVNGKLLFDDPVHENWKEIYHQVNRLQPASVFECGCGGCYHLYNIRTLMPHVEVNGCDLLQSQIQTAGGEKLQIPADILARTLVADFTDPATPAAIGRRFDFVYTQAVIMHLSHDKAFQFIKNMMALSTRHILMIEAPAHDFDALAQSTGLTAAFRRDLQTPYVSNAMLWTRI